MASLSSSRHLPTNSGVRLDKPVTLPPGRARLITSPSATGSPTVAKTMGMLLVACLAARAAIVPVATITSTLSATSSAARAGSRADEIEGLRPQRIVAGDIPGDPRRGTNGEVTGELVEAERKTPPARSDEVDLHDDRHRP